MTKELPECLGSFYVRASEQGNVIGLVRMCTYVVVIKKKL